MKTWQLESTGIENLRQVEREIPRPAPDEVLVRVRAVSLNYRDWDIVNGTYAAKVALPLIPASDAAGVVEAVGAAVTRFRAGDRVMSVFRTAWIDGKPTPEQLATTLGGHRPGVLAEYIALPEEALVPVPAGFEFEAASTLPIAAVTAWNALVEEGGLQAGETVLIQGSGGVSIFALQIAKALGARVIATSSSDEKRKRLEELGADATVNYAAEPEWDKAVLELTQGRGVDHVVEIAGGESLARSVNALAIGGHVAVIGYLDGKATALNVIPLIWKQAKIRGISVGHRRSSERMLAAFTAHRIQPVVDRTYEFSQAPAAFEHLRRGAFGKVVIQTS